MPWLQGRGTGVQIRKPAATLAVHGPSADPAVGERPDTGEHRGPGRAQGVRTRAWALLGAAARCVQGTGALTCGLESRSLDSDFSYVEAFLAQPGLPEELWGDFLGEGPSGQTLVHPRPSVKGGGGRVRPQPPSPGGSELVLVPSADLGCSRALGPCGLWVPVWCMPHPGR